MPFRKHARARRLLASVGFFAASSFSAAILSGCVGAGDDTVVPVPDAGTTSAAADASKSDGGDAGDAGAKHDAGDATVEDASDAASGPPSMALSATSIDFGPVACGSTTPATQTLTITNMGAGTLAVSASLAGADFSVSPTTLALAAGQSGGLTITTTVPASSTAGAEITGALALFTNDPAQANRIVPVSVTPSGATLSGNTSYLFPSSEVGVASQPVNVQLTNTGNAAGTFVISAPSDPSFQIAGLSSAGVTLAAGATYSAAATFTPSSTKTIDATSSITTTSATCANSVSSIAFNGQGATGDVSGWPAAIDFGPSACGGAAPAPQQVTLQNSSFTTPARVETVNISGGFSTDVTVGTGIPAAGSLVIHFTAPAVPSPHSLSPITGSLVFQTDADPAPLTIPLSVEPQGAALSFDTPSGFGSFGTVVLLQSQTQTFGVKNTGNVATNVTLAASENSSTGGGDELDAAADAGVLLPFSVSTPVFDSLPPPAAEQSEILTFQPVHADATLGQLTMSVPAGTALCQPLPQPIQLSGSASGGGPVVSPTALTFPALCGGSAPGAQSFVVANDGSLNLTWSMSAVTGPGASLFGVTTSAPPGTLIPGQSVTVEVSAASIPSPAPSPVDLAAQLTITTDVPFDSPHVVTLTEVPLGDQLSVSVGNLRFGQIPIQTSLSQTFTVSNVANPDSPAAHVGLSIVSGLTSGATAYTAQIPGEIAPDGTATATVTFDAPAAISYPATLQITTNDSLCAPLPPPIVLSGTGTSGSASLSASVLTFGTNPSDPNGFVACGATGVAQGLTIANVGNQSFEITGVDLGKSSLPNPDGGAPFPAPFALSGAGTQVPVTLPVTGFTNLEITPNPIPQTLAATTLFDSSFFGDVLTVTTNISGDSPHTVSLVMQAHGAIIANTPLQTSWNFGTVGVGSIGTFTQTIQDLGNSPASVGLEGLGLPTIFGLANNPTPVSANAVAAIVGEFSPPSQDGTWTDQGTLVVQPSDAFCQPLPSAWNSPTIGLMGLSNSAPSVTISGPIVFPTTDCGSAPPAAQPVTLTNVTNQTFAYAASLSSGQFYTLTDASGVLDAAGTATILVTPKAVSPGAGVLAGSAPYGDDVLVSVVPAGDGGAESGDAAAPSAIDFTVPVSWALNGAVLSLVDGTGPNGQGFYVADSTSGFSVRMDNTGTDSADVDFAIAPPGLFAFMPTPPIQVSPNIRALPELVTPESTSSDSGTTVAPPCPTTTEGTATFLYSGPVCQPFDLTSITVAACSGTY